MFICSHFKQLNLCTNRRISGVYWIHWSSEGRSFCDAKPKPVSEKFWSNSYFTHPLWLYGFCMHTDLWIYGSEDHFYGFCCNVYLFILLKILKSAICKNSRHAAPLHVHFAQIFQCKQHSLWCTQAGVFAVGGDNCTTYYPLHVQSNTTFITLLRTNEKPTIQPHEW